MDYEAIKAWVEELEFQIQMAQLISMVNKEENADKDCQNGGLF